MILTAAHTAARAEAARLPALQASFDLLIEDTQPASIAIYTGADPDTGTLLVTIPLASAVGSIDGQLVQIVLTVPIEGQCAATGVAGCARIFDGAGAAWADATVSDTSGAGEIQLADVALTTGAFARITAAHFQG